MPHGSLQTAARKTDHYAIWAQGFGEFARQGAQDQLPAFHTTTASPLVGLDYYVANGQWGVAFSYADSHVKNSMERDRIDFYSLFLYGTGYIGKGFIEAGIWGAYNRYHQNRHIQFPGFDHHAKAHYGGWQCAPHVRLGYDFGGSTWIFEPFGRADWAFVFQDGFSEHGASPYNMKQKKTSSNLLALSGGCNAFFWRQKQWGDWFFRASVAYLYKKGSHIGTLSQEAIVGQPQGFSVIAFKRGQNLFSPSAELFIRGKNGLFGALNYEGQIGSQYTSNAIFGKIGIFF